MPYMLATSVSLGPSYAGIAGSLRATLVGADGAAVGGSTDVATGFVEMKAGTGLYLWTYAGFPAGFRGAAVFHTGAWAGTPAVLAHAAINPEDGEDVAALAVDVPAIRDTLPMLAATGVVASASTTAVAVVGDLSTVVGAYAGMSLVACSGALLAVPRTILAYTPGSGGGVFTFASAEAWPGVGLAPNDVVAIVGPRRS